MNETLMLISSGLLLVFAILSVFDGAYFHLWKFRLQERDDSKFEHLTHTARALLFIPTLILIYTFGAKGIWAWVAVVVLGLDLVVETFDVLNEKSSRETIGGLPSNEYLLHIMLTTIRVAAFTTAFIAIPKEAWRIDSNVEMLIPEVSKLIAYNLLPGAVLILLLHVYLIFDPFFVSRIEKVICARFCKPRTKIR
jgi:hypothetical protein